MLGNFAAYLDDLSSRSDCADMLFKQTRKYFIFAVNSLVVMIINNVRDKYRNQIRAKELKILYYETLGTFAGGF